MTLQLSTLVEDFAAGLVSADAKRPVAHNQRTKAPYQPGIGPHTEAQVLSLVASEMRAVHPDRYSDLDLDVAYPERSRKRCDLATGKGVQRIFVEVKMLRLFGDNGKLNDNMLMHILSPYPENRSAVTDCGKLRASHFDGSLAILIFGYSYPGWPIEPAVSAFEAIAERGGGIGPRASARFSGLCHPVHDNGEVLAWEVFREC